MADDIRVSQPSDLGAPHVATDDIGGKHYQKIKIGWGPNNTWHETEDNDGERLPVVASLTDLVIGSITETAPASDIASSGLNGRLQRIAQRLTTAITSLGDILTQLTTAVTTISKVTSLTATVPVTTQVTEAIDIRGYQVTGIVIPSTFDGTVISFQVSADGATYQALYDMTNTQVTMTVAASRSYPLWGELAGWAYVKVETGTVQAGTDTVFVLQLNSER